MSEGGSGEIIVKGGSVEVSFDTTVYQKMSGDPSRHKHDDRKITRVRVENEDGKSLFDSGNDDSGLKWTITISTK
jgi:hypothetical protein